MEIVTGAIVEFKEDGSALISIKLPSVERACDRKYSTVEVGLPDGRTITPEQRKKAWALLGDIAEWQGDQREYLNQLFKLKFVMESLATLRREIFSLSDCDVTTAREYISYLVDFIIRWDIPTKRPLSELCEDIQRYVYTCLLNKKCAVCGRIGADLHHVDRVGMGRNRNTICQIGMQVMSLCREHHSECHQHGEGVFLDKYHLESVAMTKELGKVYELSVKNLREG